MEHPALGWMSEVEQRVKRAKKSTCNASETRIRAERALYALRKNLKEVENFVEASRKNEAQAYEELKEAGAAVRALKVKYGFVEVHDDEETDRVEERRDSASIFLVKTLEISGCGVEEANGTYHWINNGSCAFIRRGDWKEGKSLFAVFRSSDSRRWLLGAVATRSVLYSCRIEDPSENNPLDKEWSIARDGVNPPPKFEVKELLH